MLNASSMRFKRHCKGLNFMVSKTGFLLALIATVGWANSLQAQLARDVRDVFEGMMGELDEELQAKFKEAIANDTPTVEFTQEQFKRFRNNPANPFEGLNDIVLEKHESGISLKFELPSMRNRTIHPLERQSPLLLAKIRQPSIAASRSTVRLLSKKRQLVLGTIVKSDGWILTKASEVENNKGIVCQLFDGQEFAAKVVHSDFKNDLAVLKIDAKDLPVIRWCNEQITTGGFVITPDYDGKVISLGTCSVAPRSTAAGEQAFLGVQPQTISEGVKVEEITLGSASYQAGLRNGDVIIEFGGKPTPDVQTLVKSIRDRRPGDQVEIKYLRLGTVVRTTATLAGRKVSGAQAARFKMMNRLGAVPSRRDGNFPNVFQHDSPLFPEQCGGPITDLEGKVIGINIARHGRAASYAIPATHITSLLSDLMAKSKASQ